MDMEFSETAFGRLSLPYLAFVAFGEDVQRGKVLVYLHGSGDRGKSADEVAQGLELLRLIGNGVRLRFPSPAGSPGSTSKTWR